MLDLCKRFFKRIFRSLISLQGPAVLTVIFSLAQGFLFPDSPVWPIGLFAIIMIYIFSKYVKW
ncbi:hypothetical protein LZ654_16535 [Lelliottia amnigena]|nr:hypothetical protein [Lelliottia amnigena]MCE9966428.1 hypothetical protein [Lelliottia amnigena]